MKKYALYAAFALAVVMSGMQLVNPGDATVTLSSIEPVPLEKSHALEAGKNSVYIRSLAKGDTVVSGEFSKAQTDVYVYLYINDRYKDFQRVKKGNEFSFELDSPLNAEDKVHVDIGAHNSYAFFESRPVIVSGVKEVVEDSIQVAKKTQVKFGSFSLNEPLHSGDDAMLLILDGSYLRTFITVEVNGERAARVQTIKRTDRVNVKLDRTLREGDKVKVILREYRTGSVKTGTTQVVK